MKIIYYLLIVITCSSCSFNQERNEAFTDVKITTFNTDQADTIRKKWSSSDELFIGERIYPSTTFKKKSLEDIENTNIVSILLSDSIYVLILRNHKLFSMLNDSLVVMLEESDSLKVGYEIELYDEPGEMIEYKNDKSYLMLMKEPDSSYLEEMKIYRQEDFISRYLGLDKTFKEFLSKYGVDLNVDLRLDSEVLVAHYSSIEGFYLEGLIDGDADDLKYSDEFFSNTYNFVIRADSVEYLECGSVTGFF